jgi:hypothetical protein
MLIISLWQVDYCGYLTERLDIDLPELSEKHYIVSSPRNNDPKLLICPVHSGSVNAGGNAFDLAILSKI